MKAAMRLGLIMLLFTMAVTLPAYGQNVQLNLLHGWDGVREPWVDQMLDEFMKEHPGITVESQVLVAGGLAERFVTLQIAGMAPHVVMLNTATLIELADQGVITPLDEFMTRDNLDMDMWFPSEIGLGQFEGRTYGLPIRPGGESRNVLFYNKDLFNEAGLDPNLPPQTWDELLAASRILVRYDGEGSILLNPINDITQNVQIGTSMNWLYSGGGGFLSEDMKELVFASEEGIRTAEWVWEFRSTVYQNVGDDMMNRNDFIARRSAMYIEGSEGFTQVWERDPDFPLAAGPRPKREGSAYIGANTGTWHYAIPTSVAHKEEAWAC